MIAGLLGEAQYSWVSERYLKGFMLYLKIVKAHESSETVKTDDQEHALASPTNFEGHKGPDRDIKASKGLLLYEGWDR